MRVLAPPVAAPLVLPPRARTGLARQMGRRAGGANDHLRRDRGELARAKPLAAGLAACVLIRTDRCMPRPRFHPVPYRPGSTRPGARASVSQHCSRGGPRLGRLPGIARRRLPHLSSATEKCRCIGERWLAERGIVEGRRALPSGGVSDSEAWRSIEWRTGRSSRRPFLNPVGKGSSEAIGIRA